MKNVYTKITNKTPKAYTAQYVQNVHHLTGAKGIKKTFLLKIIDTVNSTHSYLDLIEDMEIVYNTLREETRVEELEALIKTEVGDLLADAETELEDIMAARRFSKNIIAFVGTIKAHSGDAMVDFRNLSEANTMDEILQAGRDLKKPSSPAVTSDDTDTKEKDTKKSTIANGKEDPKVDVQNEVQGVKDEIINHAKELTALSHDDLVDNILNLLVQVDDLKLDTMDINRLALIQTYLEKVVA